MVVTINTEKATIHNVHDGSAFASTSCRLPVEIKLHYTIFSILILYLFKKIIQVLLFHFTIYHVCLHTNIFRWVCHMSGWCNAHCRNADSFLHRRVHSERYVEIIYSSMLYRADEICLITMQWWHNNDASLRIVCTRKSG